MSSLAIHTIEMNNNAEEIKLLEFEAISLYNFFVEHQDLACGENVQRTQLQTASTTTQRLMVDTLRNIEKILSKIEDHLEESKTSCSIIDSLARQEVRAKVSRLEDLLKQHCGCEENKSDVILPELGPHVPITSPKLAQPKRKLMFHLFRHAQVLQPFFAPHIGLTFSRQSTMSRP